MMQQQAEQESARHDSVSGDKAVTRDTVGIGDTAAMHLCTQEMEMQEEEKRKDSQRVNDKPQRHAILPPPSRQHGSGAR